MSSNVCECEINSKTGELLLDDASIVLRPKTFELLLFLAEKPHHVFSKEEILASVWKGSVVEDQVIFQSINEIRKETGHPDVIKTYPRRGYSWEVANTSIDKNTCREELTIPGTSTGKTKPSHYRYWLSAFGVIGLILLYFIAGGNNTIQKPTFSNALPVEATTNNHKGILVLPFNVFSLASSQQWLRFGAMEGLINKISPDQTVTVFRLEDVIEVLNRLPISERSNVDQIFQKSGASHILETSISGQPGELNIIYTIYSRTARVTRAINTTDIDNALSELGKVFDEVVDEKVTLSNVGFNKQLQNDLIAKAMRFLEADDHESALAFIESAVINEADNIVALYFLSKINMQLDNAQESLLVANKALALKDNERLNEYKHRLFYLKGAALLTLGKLSQGEASLRSAEQLSKANKDWLYYAYSQSMLGKIRQFQGRYQEAYQRFNAALEYQELLKCPMGVAQGHLDFAELFLSNHEIPQAQKSFNIAQKLIEEKKLLKAMPLLEHVNQLF